MISGLPGSGFVMRASNDLNPEQNGRAIMLTKSDVIAPHGGTLVDRTVPAEERQERLREAAELPRVSLGPRTISDLQMISTGVFSPLEGFMHKEEYESVV